MIDHCVTTAEIFNGGNVQEVTDGAFGFVTVQ